MFPAPHQYFFPRDFTSHIGYVWHRSWRGRVSLGIRQIRDTNWRFYLDERTAGRGPAHSALNDVLAYNYGDRFRTLDGYKTLSTHWHLAYTVQALENGFDWTPPFKPVLRAMGVDASIIMDFHGDGHPRDLTSTRLTELYAHMNINYIQLDELPAFDNWGEALEPLARGDFSRRQTKCSCRRSTSPGPPTNGSWRESPSTGRFH